MPIDSQAKKLMSRWESLKLERSTTENAWQEIADNELGRRNFTTRRTPGETRMARIYDGTSKVATVAIPWNVTPDATSGYSMLPTLDPFLVNVLTEPAGVPAWGMTLQVAIGWVVAFFKNKKTQNASQAVLRNDDDDADLATSAVDTDGTTVTFGEWV